MKPNYQKLLNQFEGDIKFIKELNRIVISHDECIYEIETDKGSYFIYEVDYISGPDLILLEIKEYLGINSFDNFVKVKNQIKEFKDSPSSKFYKVFPENFEAFQSYLNDKYASAKYYFTFLIKK